MPQDKPTYPWLDGLIRSKVSDAFNPFGVFADPGSGDDIDERDRSRNGLPGTTANPYPNNTVQDMFGNIPQRVPYQNGHAPSHSTNWWSGTSTPDIDPRLVDPSNSPMASGDSLGRGDIDLDSGHEDFSQALKYYQMLRGLTASHER